MGTRVKMLPPGVARFCRNRPLGASKVIFSVWSSTASKVASASPARIQPGVPPGERSGFRIWSFHQKARSWAVKGAPSDHFIPSLKIKVYSLASSLAMTSSAALGTRPSHWGVQPIR